MRVAQIIAVIWLVIALGAVGGRVARFFQPPPEPVAVTIYYGTEKRDWLEEAAQRFEATSPTVNGRPIEIVLEGKGSREMTLETLSGEIQPTVLSPASSIHTRFLTDEWSTLTGEQIILDEDILVVTPLVVVSWENRANTLWPEGPNDETFWDDLRDALVDPQGWASYGQPEWGFIKFGHTRPTQSNSGLQTIVLLAYDYYNKFDNLTTADVLDADFQEWLIDIENGVLEFGDSTGNYMNEMVLFGPSKYDFVVVYENLAIENFEAAEGRWEPIRVFYPPVNIWSDHPYAILDAEWVTEDQQAAAGQFRDFLLSTDMQELALRTYGFRPGNLDVAVNIPGNPFERYASYGVQLDIPQGATAPPGNVLNELIELWRRRVDR